MDSGKKHSTELAVLEVIDRITNQLDQGITRINIYLDLSKSFDTLDHDILLNKLQYYVVNGSALALFRSYLTERRQYVDYNETSSSLEHISTGVPQGSILGPLLFIIYINDIAQSSPYFNFILALRLELLRAYQTAEDYLPPLCVCDLGSPLPTPEGNESQLA